jgi:alpha-glucoside transport system permease protein
MTLVPVLRLYSATGLTGTFLGIWLVHLGFALPFAVYLLRTFFASLPGALFEAAEIDGASLLTAFLRVALPVSRPALVSVVSNLVSASTGQGWHLLTAAAFIAMAVPMVIFVALQRYFVRGLLAGTGK